MKKIILFAAAALFAVVSASCSKNRAGEGIPEATTTLGFNVFNTRADNEHFKSYRIIAFRITGREVDGDYNLIDERTKVALNSGKLTRSVDEMPYVCSLKLGLYHFVFIANEPADMESKLDTYLETSALTYENFKAESFGADNITFYTDEDGEKENVRMEHYKTVQLYADHKYQIDGQLIAQGLWLAKVNRPYIRVVLNFFLNYAQSEDFEKGRAGVNDNSKIVFSDVPGGILFGGGANSGLPNLSDYTLHFRNGAGDDNFSVAAFGDPAYSEGVTNAPGTTGWKRYSTTLYLPENIHNNKTDEQEAIALNIVLDGTAYSALLYNRHDTDDYSLYRNNQYTFNCTVANAKISYSVGVVKWEEGDKEDVEEEIKQ